MRTLFWSLLLLCGLLLPAQAMEVAYSDEELIASSDVIVIGTVVNTSELPDVAPGWPAGRATIKVSRVIKGPQVGLIIIGYHTPPKMPPGMIMMDHGGMVLQPGMERLFMLQADPTGYCLTMGRQAMKPLEETDRVVKIIEGFTYDVTLETLPAQVEFNKPFTVTFVVKNTGQNQVQLTNPMLEIAYCSPRVGRSTMLMEIKPVALAGAAPSVIIAEPGKSATLRANFQVAMPDTLKLVPEDSYLQTPLQVRGKIFLQAQTVGVRKTLQSFYAATPWSRMLVGFPPPPPASLMAATPLARQRALQLREAGSSFSLRLNYNGAEDKPMYRIFAGTGPIPPAPAPNGFSPQLAISEKQSVAIIDYLATEGYLENARDMLNVKRWVEFTQPGYSLEVSAYTRNGQVRFADDLKWGTELIARLKGLRTVIFEPGLLKALDSLITRAGG